MQNLANVDVMREEMERLFGAHHGENEDETVAEMRKFLVRHQDSSKHARHLQPTRFHARVVHVQPFFRGLQQHDAQELLLQVMDVVHEGEVKRMAMRRRDKAKKMLKQLEAEEVAETGAAAAAEEAAEAAALEATTAAAAAEAAAKVLESSGGAAALGPAPRPPRISAWAKKCVPGAAAPVKVAARNDVQEVRVAIDVANAAAAAAAKAARDARESQIYATLTPRPTFVQSLFGGRLCKHRECLRCGHCETMLCHEASFFEIEMELPQKRVEEDAIPPLGAAAGPGKEDRWSQSRAASRSEKLQAEKKEKRAAAKESAAALAAQLEESSFEPTRWRRLRNEPKEKQDSAWVTKKSTSRGDLAEFILHVAPLDYLEAHALAKLSKKNLKKRKEDDLRRYCTEILALQQHQAEGGAIAGEAAKKKATAKVEVKATKPGAVAAAEVEEADDELADFDATCWQPCKDAPGPKETKQWAVGMSASKADLAKFILRVAPTDFVDEHHLPRNAKYLKKNKELTLYCRQVFAILAYEMAAKVTATSKEEVEVDFVSDVMAEVESEAGADAAAEVLAATEDLAAESAPAPAAGEEKEPESTPASTSATSEIENGTNETPSPAACTVTAANTASTTEVKNEGKDAAPAPAAAAKEAANDIASASASPAADPKVEIQTHDCRNVFSEVWIQLGMQSLTGTIAPSKVVRVPILPQHLPQFDALSLEGCLAAFSAPELMLRELGQAIDCSECKMRTDSKQRYSIVETPPCLSLLLKRFTQQQVLTTFTQKPKRRRGKKKKKNRNGGNNGNDGNGKQVTQLVTTSVKNSAAIKFPIVLRLDHFSSTLAADADGKLHIVAPPSNSIDEASAPIPVEQVSAPAAAAVDQVSTAAPAAECGAVEKKMKRKVPSKGVYVLKGIVEHSGTMRGGHYVAYVHRSPPVLPAQHRGAGADAGADEAKSADADTEAKSADADSAALGKGDASSPSLAEDEAGRIEAARRGEWFFASDANVRRVTEAAVLKAQAYVLFYRKVL